MAPTTPTATARASASPAYDINVVDTTGCGDAFDAGFIAALHHGMDIETALRFAQASAGLVATGLGSDAGIVSFEDTLDNDEELEDQAMRFQGSRAVVTGGLSGIGEAVAKRIAAEGGKVAVWDMNGGIKTDISDYDSVEAAARRNHQADWRHRHSGEQCRHHRPHRTGR